MSVEAPDIISPQVEGINHSLASFSATSQVSEDSRGKELEKQAKKVIILGAGISGLTTGILLREKGYDAEIWTEKISPDTTSDVAGGVWFPYNVQGDGLTEISRFTLERLKEQQREFGSGATGIILSEVIELKLEETKVDPWWRDAADNFHRPTKKELPPGYNDGFAFDAPVIDMTKYLDFLMDTFKGQGGSVKILSEKVTNIADVLNQSPIVVNCTGNGSRELLGDTEIYPARGQVLKVRPNGLRRILIDEDTNPQKPTYIVPRQSDMVLGGSNEPDNHNPNPTDAETQSILERCATLDPSIAKITPDQIIGPKVGFRPNRRSIRLEGENPTPEKLLVHNYGHGGSGITLSWGCANEVVKIVDRFH